MTLKSELIVDKVTPASQLLEITGKLQILNPTNGEVKIEFDPDTGALFNKDISLTHNDLDIPVLVLQNPSGLGFGYITDSVTFNNNKVNPNKGIKFHTDKARQHNTFTIGNIQGGLGSITITPKDTQSSAGFTEIEDQIVVHTSEFKTTDVDENEYIKVKDGNVYIGKAASGSQLANYTGSDVATRQWVGTGSVNVFRGPAEFIDGDIRILGNIKQGVGSVQALSTEGSLLFSHFTHHTGSAFNLGEGWTYQSYRPDSRGQLAIHSGREQLPTTGSTTGLEAWISNSAAGIYGEEVQALQEGSFFSGPTPFQTTNPAATQTFITDNNIGRDSQPSIMSRGSLTIGIDGIAIDGFSSPSFFEVISGVNDIANFANATTLLLVDTSTQTTFVQNLSSSGDLFANASFSDNTSYRTVVIDPNTGRFYHTGSYGGAGSATFQSLTDGPGVFIVTDAEGLETNFANYAVQVNSNGTSLEYVQAVQSASFASNAHSASYAVTASFVASNTSIDSSSYATTSSFAHNANSSSYAVNATNANTASFVVSASYAVSSSYATTASFSHNSNSSSYAVNATNALTASFVASDTSIDNATSASYAVTSSFTHNANSSSHAENADDAVSSSYAVTSSYALNTDSATTYLELTDTDDTSFSSKDNHVPVVRTVFDSSTGAFVKKLKLEATVSQAQSSLFATKAISGGLGFNIPGTAIPFHVDHNGFKSVGNGLILGDLGISGSLAVGTGLTISDISISSSTNAFIFGSSSANTVNHEMTGNLLMNSSVGITANMPADTVGFIGTASFAVNATNALTASFVASDTSIDNATSASFATTASFAHNANSSNSSVSSSYISASNIDGTVTSASYAISSSYVSASSIDGTVTSASHADNAINAITASYASNAEGSGFPFSGSAVVTGSLLLSGSGFITASHITASTFSGSLFGTSSYADRATSASHALNSNTASFVLSASYALNSEGESTFLALSDTPPITSYSIGHIPVINGNNDALEFVQAVNSASFALNAHSSSYAVTASFVASDTSIDNATSASFATTASFAEDANSSSYAINSTTASFAENANSSSYAVSASNVLSSSYALSSSHALTASFVASDISVDTASYAQNINEDNLTLSFPQLIDVPDSGDFTTLNGYPLGVGGKVVQVKDGGSEIEFVQTVQSASFAVGAHSASYAINTTTASYADTASHAEINFVDLGDTTETTLSGNGGNVLVVNNNGTNIIFSDTVSQSHSSSFASNAHSASYAVTASFVASDISIDNATSASYAITSSFAENANSSSYAVNSTTSSFAENANSSSYAINSTTASYALESITASFALNSNSSSYAVNSTTASYAVNSTTASFAENANSSSYAVNSTTSSYTLTAQTLLGNVDSATSASYAVNSTSASNADTAILAISGGSADNEFHVVNDAFVSGNLSVSGTVGVGVAVTIADITISASSNAFIFGSGSDPAITHQMTGNLALSGSTGITVDMPADTVGFIGTSSFAEKATSASYALTASFVASNTSIDSATSASFATTASFAHNANSSSYAISSSYALDSTTASFAENAHSSSYAVNSTTSSFALNSNSSSFAENANSSSYAVNATNAITASFVASTTSIDNATSASYATTASFAENAHSSSYAVTSSYSLNDTFVELIDTPSTYLNKGLFALQVSANSESVEFVQAVNSASFASQSVSASYAFNATTASFAENIQTTFVALTDTADAMGSPGQVLQVNNSQDPALVFVDAVTSASHADSALTASFIASDAFIDNATSASFATTASYAVSASNVVSSSFAENAHSASFAENAHSSSYTVNSTTASFAENAYSSSHADNTISSSFSTNAHTASFALNATSPFPFIGAADITGSLALTNGIGDGIDVPFNFSLTDSTHVSSSAPTIEAFPLHRMFDNSVDFGAGSAVWQGNVGSSYNDLIIDFNIKNAIGFAPIIDRAQFIFYNLSSYTHKRIQISGSNDGSTFIPIAQESSSIASNEYDRDFRFDNQLPFEILRFTFDKNEFEEDNLGILEFTLYPAEASVIATSFTGSLSGTSSHAVTASYAVSASNVSTNFVDLLDVPFNDTYSGLQGYVPVVVGADHLDLGGYLSLTQTVQSASFASNAHSASYAVNSTTASFALNSNSSSYAVSSSYATTASFIASDTNIDTSSFALTAFESDTSKTASFAHNAHSSSYAITASFAHNAHSSSYAVNSTTASFALNSNSSSYAVTASNALEATTSSYAVSSSFAENSNSSSYAVNSTTASFALNSNSSSFAENANSSSYAVTASFIEGTTNINNATSASYADTASNAISGGLSNVEFYAHDTLIDGDLAVSGSVGITAGLTISDVQISSSANAFTFGSGSTNAITHQMTGNLALSASTGITANMPANTVGFIGTASFAQTSSHTLSSSYATNAITASYIHAFENSNTQVDKAFKALKLNITDNLENVNLTSIGATTASVLLDINDGTGYHNINKDSSFRYEPDRKLLFTTSSHAISASHVTGKVLSASYAETASFVEGLDVTTTYLELTDTSDTTFEDKNLFVPVVKENTINPALSKITLRKEVRSSSYALSSSHAIFTDKADTASFAITSSFALLANHAFTADKARFAESASHADNSISSSYALQAQHAFEADKSLFSVSSSYAETASFVENSGDAISSSYAVSSSFANFAEDSNLSQITKTVVTQPNPPQFIKLLGAKKDDVENDAEIIYEEDHLRFDSVTNRLVVGNLSQSVVQELGTKTLIDGALKVRSEIYQEGSEGIAYTDAGILMGERGVSPALYIRSALQPYYRMLKIDQDKNKVFFGNANDLGGVGDTYIEAGPYGNRGNKLILNALPFQSGLSSNRPIFITGSVDDISGGWMNIKNGLTIGVPDKIDNKPLVISSVTNNEEFSKFEFDVKTNSGFLVQHTMGSPNFPETTEVNTTGGYTIYNSAKASNHPTRFKMNNGDGVPEDVFVINNTNGNVTIGGAQNNVIDLTSSHKLLVNGTARIENKFFVGGDSLFEASVTMNSNLVVDGNGTISNELLVGNPNAGTGGTIFYDNLSDWSDKRLKENIVNLEPQLDIIKKLKPRKYTRKNKIQLGFIAQEVKKVIPEIVNKHKDNGYYGIEYTKFAPILVKAIQEQQELIEKLSARIDELEKK